MALETLKGVTEIGGFKVWAGDVKGSPDWQDKKEDHFVCLDDTANSIAFKIQNGPIKEVGVNGCQVDTVIEAAKAIIEGLNAKFPCRENSLAVTKLDEALHWLEARKKNREKISPPDPDACESYWPVTSKSEVRRLNLQLSE